MSKRPRKKVVAGAVAGSATVVIVWLLGQFGVDVPPEVASALTVLLGSGAAYLKREHLDA